MSGPESKHGLKYGLKHGLKVGLTGGLGSGKTTVARMFAVLGVHTLSADEIGRELMSPGQPVYSEIASRFGPSVLRPDGALDRKALAALAFTQGRLQELNQIVHPAVIAVQEAWAAKILAQQQGAIVMVESALIFEVDRDADRRGGSPAANIGLKQRFDKIILIVVPEEQKIARYMARVSPGGWNDAIEADARARLAAQIPDNQKITRSDFVIQNSGTLEETAARVKEIYSELEQLTDRSSESSKNPAKVDASKADPSALTETR